MFSIFAGFIYIFLLPFALGPASAFHEIKEQHRYQKQKLTTSILEQIVVYLGVGIIIILFYMWGYHPSLIPHSGKIFSIDLIVLASFYLIKLAFSYHSRKPISVLIGFSIASDAQRVTALLLFVLLLLVGLENLHIIPTYLH